MKEKTIIIGVNGNYEIKAVNDKSLPTLRFYEFLDTPEQNFFYGWQEEEILKYCYKETKTSKVIYPQQDYLDTKTRNIASKVYKEQEEKYTTLVEENTELKENAEISNGCIMELSELIGELLVKLEEVYPSEE